MKKIIFHVFAFIFRFEVEKFYLYRVQSTGLKVYKRDFHGNSKHETFIGVRFVLRQK
jgi:hypothetical protein